MLKTRYGTALLVTLIVGLVVMVIIQAEELAHRTEAARLREQELTAAQSAGQSELALKQAKDYSDQLRKEIQRLQAQTKALESQVTRLKSRESGKAKTDN